MSKKFIRMLILIALLQILLGISGCSEQRASTVTVTTAAQNTSESSSTLNLTPNESLKSSNSSNLSGVNPVQGVPVLYYHSVMYEQGNEVRMPPEQFEAQMAYLWDKGYESITLDQLDKAFNNRGVLPAKPFVITFDDGYVDNYTNAFPILEKYRFTASVFMVTSYIGGEGFMSWPQLKELSANGWEIEGHTVNHPYLSQMEKTSMLNELISSKETLEKGLAKKVKFFAYPYGDVNDKVEQAVKDTGYLMAFTTERGWADRNDLDEWHLKRVYCFADMGLNEFARRLQDPNY